MSNFVYNKMRDYLANAWLTNTVKILLLNLDNYTPDPANHQYLSDIPLAARVGTAQLVTGKTVSSGGVIDADDVTFPNVTGAVIQAYVHYFDTGTESTSKLFDFVHEATGLPITPNGGPILFVYDNGANKIVRI